MPSRARARILICTRRNRDRGRFIGANAPREHTHLGRGPLRSLMR